MSHIIATKILKLDQPIHPYFPLDFKPTQELVLADKIIPGTIEKINDIFIFKIYNDEITDEYTCLSAPSSEPILIDFYRQQRERF